MARKSRVTRKKRGRPIEVRFVMPDEDRLIREIAAQESRSAADTVRLLALAEAKRRAEVAA
jgi:hypothetical protein